MPVAVQAASACSSTTSDHLTPTGRPGRKANSRRLRERAVSERLRRACMSRGCPVEARRVLQSCPSGVDLLALGHGQGDGQVSELVASEADDHVRPPTHAGVHGRVSTRSGSAWARRASRPAQEGGRGLIGTRDPQIDDTGVGWLRPITLHQCAGLHHDRGDLADHCAGGRQLAFVGRRQRARPSARVRVAHLAVVHRDVRAGLFLANEGQVWRPVLARCVVCELLAARIRKGRSASVRAFEVRGPMSSA